MKSLIMKKIFNVSIIFIVILFAVSFVSATITKAIELKDPVIIHNIGYYAYKKGNFNLAEKLFSKAISIDNNYEKAYYSRSIVRNKLKNYDGAISDLKILEGFNNKNVQYSYDLAINQIDNFRFGTNKLSDFCNGKQSYEKVMKIDPYYSQARNNLKIINLIQKENGIVC